MCVLAFVESLNSDDAGSKSLAGSHFDGIGLFTATTEESPILPIAASKFVQNSNMPGTFHAPTSYTRARLFLGQQRAMFNKVRTDSAFEMVEFLKKAISHTYATSIYLLKVFFSRMPLHSYDSRDKNEA